MQYARKCQASSSYIYPFGSYRVDKQTEKLTNKQTPLKISTSLCYATPVSKHIHRSLYNETSYYLWLQCAKVVSLTCYVGFDISSVLICWPSRQVIQIISAKSAERSIFQQSDTDSLWSQFPLPKPWNSLARNPLLYMCQRRTLGINDTDLYETDAVPVTKPTVSKHWRKLNLSMVDFMLLTGSALPNSQTYGKSHM